MEVVVVKLLFLMVVVWLVWKLNCKLDMFFNFGCEEFIIIYIVCGIFFVG